MDDIHDDSTVREDYKHMMITSVVKSKAKADSMEARRKAK
jgi:hypothetical protein